MPSTKSHAFRRFADLMPRIGGSVGNVSKARRTGRLAAAIGQVRFPRGKICCAAMLGWLYAAPIHAGQSDYGFGLSFDHESNIGRVATNPVSDTAERLFFGLAYREDTANVNGRFLAQVERRRFIRNTFPSSTGAFVSGAMVWTLLPQRVTWMLAENLSEARINITAPGTPSNYAKANSIATGPDFAYPLRSTDTVMIGGRYGRYDVRGSTDDSRRYGAYARGVHAFSNQAKLSLNYEVGRVYFNPAAQIPDISLENAFVRYESISSANGALVDLGTTRVTQYGGSANCKQPPAATPLPSPCVSSSSTGPNRLARLTLLEKLSSQSTFYLRLSDQISDTYSDRIQGLVGYGLGGTTLAGMGLSTAPREPAAVAYNGTDIASSDLYRSKRGELSYVRDDGVIRYMLQAYGRNVDFATLDQDYREVGGTFLWGRNSGATLLNAYASYLKRTFTTVDPGNPLFGRQDTDRDYKVSVAYKLNSNVTVVMEGERFAQVSTAFSSSFVDNRVMLLLGYSSGSLYGVQLRR